MKTEYKKAAQFIQDQYKEMVSLLENLANINSGTENLAGLNDCLKLLKSAFLPLGAEIEELPLTPFNKVDAKGNLFSHPLGKALRIKKHSNAKEIIFLSGHMDTVYPAHTEFKKVERLSQNKMRGPGVTDMKGGLIVLLYSLLALEKSSLSGKIGWEVLINPDEEIGSPGSKPLFIEAAKRCHLAFTFEPAYPDGALVSARKGSMNLVIVSKGKAAHAGRDFYSGRSAISALIKFMMKIEALNDKEKGITINIGHVEGGGALNIVPELAICRLNIRMETIEDLSVIKGKINTILEESTLEEGISLKLYEQSISPPKIFDPKSECIFNQLKELGKQLGIELTLRKSGGVCDGNTLSNAGLPVIDTMGVVGGDIHTADEYILLDSLSERASLMSLYLLHKASGES